MEPGRSALEVGEMTLTLNQNIQDQLIQCSTLIGQLNRLRDFISQSLL